MATQKGIVKFSGKLGDLIFYQGKKKALVRQVKKDGMPFNLSEGSKQSGKDFGEASKSAAYIRKALAPLIKKYANDSIVNRLNKRLVEVLNNIPSEKRGFKKLIDGDLSSLTGFEFNSEAPLNKFLYQHPIISIAVDGKLNLTFAKNTLDSLFLLNIPNAIEICLNLMIFVFDLAGENYEYFKVNELNIPLYAPSMEADFTIDTEQIGDRGLIIAMGMHYRDEYDMINNRQYFGCQVIKTLHLKDGIVVIPSLPIADKKRNNEEDDTGLSWNIKLS